MSEPQPPRYLKPMNKLMMAVQKLGIPTGPAMVLTVPGRKSGQPRSTPMTPFEFQGGLYVVAGYPGADWAANARAAGAGTLARGRRRNQVRIVELTAEEARRYCGPFRRKCRWGFRSRSARGWCATERPTSSRRWPAGSPSSDSSRCLRCPSAPATGQADCGSVRRWRTGWPLRSASDRSWFNANARARPASGITTPAHSPSAPDDSTASFAHIHRRGHARQSILASSSGVVVQRSGSCVQAPSGISCRVLWRVVVVAVHGLAFLQESVAGSAPLLRQRIALTVASATVTVGTASNGCYDSVRAAVRRCGSGKPPGLTRGITRRSFARIRAGLMMRRPMVTKKPHRGAPLRGRVNRSASSVWPRQPFQTNRCGSSNISVAKT